MRSILGSGTAISYAADWSEYFGHQPGDGSGDVFFHLDPLWADPEIDFVGIDNYMPLSDWRDGFEHADAAEGWPAIYDRAYLQGNIAGGEGFDWFYASAADRSAQVRTRSRMAPRRKPWVFRYKDLRAWWSNAHYDRPGGVESGTPTAWAPQSKPIWFTELGCPPSTGAPTSPTSSSIRNPPRASCRTFSRGWRDDAIQRAYLEATYLWWGEAANNPVSSVYGGRMVHVPECAAWTWDARPYPFFPALTDVWTDGGELAARPLADRAARRGVAGGTRPAPLPARRACPRIASTSPASGARSRATPSRRWKARAPRSPRCRATSASTRWRPRA